MSRSRRPVLASAAPLPYPRCQLGTQLL